VCALTGFNPVTLRAWERRYGLIKPVRTPGGHRMYTQEQVDQINRALAMLERGTSIGSAARTLRGGTAPASLDVWAALRTRIIASIARFDEAALEAIYESALALQPIEAVTRKLLVPVLEELGRRWERAEGRVAEEHFFTTYTRNKLGARLHHRRRTTSRLRLLCACVPGEQHELGLLLFALAAHDNDVGCVVLGPDMPMEELAIVCARARCDGIVLSMSMEPQSGWLEQALPQLVAKVRKPVYVGGRSSAAHGDAIARAAAVAIGADISNGLRRILSGAGHSHPRARRAASALGSSI
jgi:DNA-binding transcriptional MerR regulator